MAADDALVAEQIEYYRARAPEYDDWFLRRGHYGEPARRYDAVVMGFFLSHVPAARLDGFLRKVAQALRPGGWLFYVDSLPAPTAARADRPPTPRDGEVQLRQLDDGRVFSVVKNYWPRMELAARFVAAGMDVEVRDTATYFQYGTGPRAPHR